MEEKNMNEEVITESSEDETKEEKSTKLTLTEKIIVGGFAVGAIVIIVAVVWFLWFWLSGGLSNFLNHAANELEDEIQEELQEAGQHYIDVVKTAPIGKSGVTYKELADSLENPSWSYFISEEGWKVVQLTGDSYMGDVVMQIVVTNVGDDQLSVDPRRMAIDGQSIGDIIAAVLLLV